MTSLPPRVYSQATELKAWLLRLVLNRNFPRDQILQDNRVSPVGIAPKSGIYVVLCGIRAASMD
jgi:hypothetical protein